MLLRGVKIANRGVARAPLVGNVAVGLNGGRFYWPSYPDQRCAARRDCGLFKEPAQGASRARGQRYANRIAALRSGGKLNEVECDDLRVFDVFCGFLCVVVRDFQRNE